MKRLLLLAVLSIAIVGGWLAQPARWEVEGLSMAPGLMPGDVVASGPFPLLDRWRRPQRFERWTLAAPDGALVIKRIWGVPGEELSIVDGDLVVAGKAIVKPPCVLAEVALRVDEARRHETDGAVRLTLPDPVFDDMPFAPDERRVLVPVYDVGVTAVIDVSGGDHAGAPVLIEITVGGRAVRVALCRAGRHAVVAGRLDGALVAAAWPQPMRSNPRSCLPSGCPEVWMMQCPWHDVEPVTSLEVRVIASASHTTRAMIRDVVAWRDVHHLPPASGITHWRLQSDAWFVLGDSPGASRDSRQWGPVGSGEFHQRLSTPPR